MPYYNSILDIIGPEMIGPSSSHTAGAVRLGNLARSILNKKLKKVRISLYNSFAETGIGHGTHKAIIAGLLGFSKSDERIKYADRIAKKLKIKVIIKKVIKPNDYLPNTAVIEMYSGKLKIEVVGASLGGGLVLVQEIDGFEVNITGDYETLIVTHKDKIGILAEILKVISFEKMNIVSINSVRRNKIDDVTTLICFDNFIKTKIPKLLGHIEYISRIRVIHKMQENW